MSLLSHHPATAEILVRLGIFPNLYVSRRRLRRMHERGEIGFVQAVEIDKGIRRLVYAKERLSNPLHELEITELCLRIQATEIRRLHSVNKQFNADAEIMIDDTMFFLELDRGTEGYAQVKKQMNAYENADVLWIAPTETRLKGLMALTTCSTFWFATYDQAMTPHGEVWRNIHGEMAALPMPREATA